MGTDLLGLEGKVAIVSGVGPGLGVSTARLLAEAGAKLVLAARSSDRLEALQQELAATGAEAIAVPTDLADPRQAAGLAAAAFDAFGAVDVLVHNAFTAGAPAGVVDADYEDWRRIFEVNLYGPLELTKACRPHLVRAAAERGDASVVFVTSMAMRKVRVGDGAYAISKGSLHTTVKMLALELGPEQVRVNAVAPGWIDGPSVQQWITWDASQRGVSEAEVRGEIEARIPLGQRIPTSDDIAGSVLLMASPRSLAVTGQTLDANGGEYFAQ
ncbi:MAG: SDR family oxidoreductase [Myxococcota bacterium]